MLMPKTMEKQKEEQAQRKDNSNSTTSLMTEKFSHTPLMQMKKAEHDRLFNTAQPKPNKTGLPDKLKSGIENLSGISMDNVRVHYNSPKPKDFDAAAYTQGTNIHVAPGAEKHLPHEAWHVVQQAQGRVMPTMQMKDISINDDSKLEREADITGEKALNTNEINSTATLNLVSADETSLKSLPVQMAKDEPRKKKKVPKRDPAKKLYSNRAILKKIGKKILHKNPGLENYKKAHKSKIYRAKLKLVKAKKKNKHIAFLRHLCVVINSQKDKKFQEVQAAISKKNKTAYISSNSKMDELPKDIKAILKIAENKNNEKGRIKRHKEKLVKELKGDFKDFEIEVVTTGKQGQHAETKLVDYLEIGGLDYDYIWGQRRPCIACEIYFKLKGIDQKKYNKHHGSFWNTQNANLAILRLMKMEIMDDPDSRKRIPKNKLKEWSKDNSNVFKVKNKSFKNKKIAKKEEDNFDTDSEDESEEET